MKNFIKLAVALSFMLLCMWPSVVFAQTSNINSVSSPTSVNLNAVCIVNSPDAPDNDLTEVDAWAVGDSGTIVHWDGNSWTTVTSPTTNNLYSVVFSSTELGRAVGGTLDRGIILRYDGSSWSEWKTISYSGNQSGTDPMNATLYSVTSDPSGMVGWIVGAGGETLGWDGITWYGISSGVSDTLRSVAMVHGSNDAWAVGDNGRIVHWNGATWTSLTTPTMQPLYTIQMINASNAWAAGGTPNSGVVLNYDGSGWNTFKVFRFGTGGDVSESINATIYSMSFGAYNSAWAVGSGGLVMYFTGTEWDCNANIINGNLKGVSMIHGAENNVQAWTAGDSGQILAFNGTQWVPEIPVIMLAPILLSIGLVIFLVKTRTKKPFFKKLFFFWDLG